MTTYFIQSVSITEDTIAGSQLTIQKKKKKKMVRKYTTVKKIKNIRFCCTFLKMNLKTNQSKFYLKNTIIYETHHRAIRKEKAKNQVIKKKGEK